MGSTIINVRTDPKLKKEADELFNELGLNMSTAINIFLRQSVRECRIPFDVKLDIPNAVTRAAIEEGNRLLNDPNARSFDSVEEFRRYLEDED